MLSHVVSVTNVSQVLRSDNESSLARAKDQITAELKLGQERASQKYAGESVVS